MVVHDPVYQTYAEGYAYFSLQPIAYVKLAAEFIQICRAVAVGFAVMGFIGYFVKLIHIPMWVKHRLEAIYLHTELMYYYSNNILVYVDLFARHEFQLITFVCTL